MKVENYLANHQFHIYGENKHYLQSYKSLVVKIEGKYSNPTITLGKDWDYSRTTLKYVYSFIEDYSHISFYGIKDKRKYIDSLIKDGIIKYDEQMK